MTNTGRIAIFVAVAVAVALVIPAERYMIHTS